MTMKKIIVIGCPGGGKSTFARQLRDKTGLPLHYLDMIWHKPDKSNVTRAEFDKALQDILSGDRWIIDGNYSRTLEVRMAACDTVILLDMPLEVCLAGAMKRIGTKREELPWVEDRFDEEFKAHIEHFGDDELPKIYKLLEKHNNKTVVIFKSHADIADFLEGL